MQSGHDDSFVQQRGAPEDHEVEEQGNNVEGYAKNDLECTNLQHNAQHAPNHADLKRQQRSAVSAGCGPWNRELTRDPYHGLGVPQLHSQVGALTATIQYKSQVATKEVRDWARQLQWGC